MFELVDRLDAYCKIHFLDEEKLMNKMDFSEIDDHTAQHALFVRHLEKFMNGNEALDCDKNIEELNSLKEWYLEHIAAFDRKYSERLLGLNGAASQARH